MAGRGLRGARSELQTPEAVPSTPGGLQGKGHHAVWVLGAQILAVWLQQVSEGGGRKASPLGPQIRLLWAEEPDL